jgi:hypothetical protein
VGAFEVAEFDDLVVDVAGITVGDDEVTFAFLYRNNPPTAGQERRGAAGGVDGDVAGNFCAIGEQDAARWEKGLNADTQSNLRAEALGAFDEIASAAGRIEDAVFAKAERAREAGAELGLALGELLGIPDFSGDVVFVAEFLFAVDFGHFFLVGGDPKGAARVEFDISGKARRFSSELPPEIAGVTGHGELGRRIVHNHEVAHAAGGHPPTDAAGIDDKDLESAGGTFRGTGGTDDAGADDYDVKGRVHCGYFGR